MRFGNRVGGDGALPLVVAAWVVLVGCSGKQTETLHSYAAGGAATGGSSGEPNGGDPSRPDVTGGLGGEGGMEVGEAGAAGSGQLPSSKEIAKEIACVVGSSFVVEPSAYDEEYLSGEVGSAPPFVAPITLRFARGGDGELSLLTSTLGATLRVEESRVVRTDSGWSVVNPAPAGGYVEHVFEEEVAPTWMMPSELELSFDSRQCPPQKLSLHFAFSDTTGDGRHGTEPPGHEAGTIDTSAMLDQQSPRITPPSWLEYSPGDHGYFPTRLPNWQPPRHFEFAEELQPGWVVSVIDDAGKTWEVARDRQGAGAVGGFDVWQFFPPGSHWSVKGRDLAGNPFADDLEYPMYLSDASDGQFEGSTSDADHGVGPYCYGSYAGFTDIRNARDGFLTLAGDQSLDVECGVEMRIARVANATELRFRARVYTTAPQEPKTLSVAVQPLDAGASAAQPTEVEDWTADPAHSTGNLLVSEAREVSIPLPAGSKDVMLAFTGRHFLLDDVHTQ
ncbi:MAG TPA: hypothetical protein VHB79_27965 [Polyangiaceae bacterium]|nr:hypothetical protein [Polyangiaceae bacterium]